MQIKLAIPIQTEEELEKLNERQDSIDSFFDSLLNYLYPERRHFNLVKKTNLYSNGIKCSHRPSRDPICKRDGQDVYGAEFIYSVLD